MNFKSLIKAALPVILAFSASASAHAAPPAEQLLTPTNHTLLLIDHQS